MNRRTPSSQESLQWYTLKGRLLDFLWKKEGNQTRGNREELPGIIVKPMLEVERLAMWIQSLIRESVCDLPTILSHVSLWVCIIIDYYERDVRRMDSCYIWYLVPKSWREEERRRQELQYKLLGERNVRKRMVDSWIPEIPGHLLCRFKPLGISYHL